MSLSRKPAILLMSSVIQPRVVIVGASMRTPPGESAEASPGTVLRFKEMDAASHTFSTLDPSVRVDIEPRAPSDCQFRHWRACAPWQSRPLQK